MEKIRICEIFESIQGEGLTVGSPAVFVRTGRCSVGCKFCDTKYAWNLGEDKTVEEIVNEIKGRRLPEVVVTGGEPLEEDGIAELIRRISEVEFIRKITVETCGHVFRKLPIEKLHLVISPKPPTMGVEFPRSEVKKFLKIYSNVELKFTVFSGEDFSAVKNFLYSSPKVPEPVVIQPLNVPFENYAETCRKVVSMVLSDRKFISDFQVRVIPQVHKLIGVK